MTLCPWARQFTLLASGECPCTNCKSIWIRASAKLLNVNVQARTDLYNASLLRRGDICHIYAHTDIKDTLRSPYIFQADYELSLSCLSLSRSSLSPPLRHEQDIQETFWPLLSFLNLLPSPNVYTSYEITFCSFSLSLCFLTCSLAVSSHYFGCL